MGQVDYHCAGGITNSSRNYFKPFAELDTAPYRLVSQTHQSKNVPRRVPSSVFKLLLIEKNLTQATKGL